MRQLKEQLSIEKQVWQENYCKKQEAELMARERELQQQVKQSRDAEIERVMQQLLRDNQQAIDDCEREADKRITYDRPFSLLCGAVIWRRGSVVRTSVFGWPICP